MLSHSSSSSVDRIFPFLNILFYLLIYLSYITIKLVDLFSISVTSVLIVFPSIFLLPLVHSSPSYLSPCVPLCDATPQISHRVADRRLVGGAHDIFTASFPRWRPFLRFLKQSTEAFFAGICPVTAWDDLMKVYVLCSTSGSANSTFLYEFSSKIGFPCTFESML